VLQKGAALLALAFVAGCGTSMPSGKPEPLVERHVVYEKAVGENGIWIADVDGSHPRLLLRTGQMPSISPDGKWVAYFDECTRSKVGCTYVVSTSGGKPRLLSTRRLDEAIVWSPTSERITSISAYRGHEYQQGDEPDELVSIEVATGKAVTLAQGQFGGWSFSPDGKRIVFALGTALYIDFDLYVVSASGGHPQRITDTEDSDTPVWGPDAIAFAKTVYGNETDRAEIWRIQPDGDDLQRITGRVPNLAAAWPHNSDLFPIEWSADGHALLAGHIGALGIKPIAVDPEKGTARELSGYGPPGGVHPVALSGDGRWVLIENSRAEVAPEDFTLVIAPYSGEKASIVATGATAPSWNR
jgi:dipeptidyl aminopeptidase/acylaminoacyl peptidase